jgi:DNA-binding HxlR family transcriptional regulator
MNQGSTQTLAANSARRALAILGDRWTLLILRDAFLGVQQFHVWQTRLGITPAVLTRRLARMVEAGIFRRVSFRESPPRVEYHLTEKGLDIYDIALVVLRWEQNWFTEESTLVLRHEICGHICSPRFVCGSCGQDAVARDVRHEPGPGAGRDRAIEGRQRRASVTAADSRATHKYLEHVLDVLGDRWTWEVLSAAFFGKRRFDDIQAETGMATNILSDRLRRLVTDGILTRSPYQQRPERHEYRLTPKGLDLFPAMTMLTRWGDRWLADKRGPPLLLVHKTCGKPLDARVVCSACGVPLVAKDVTFEFK